MRAIVTGTVTFIALWALTGAAVDHEQATGHRVTASPSTAPMVHRINHARLDTWDCQAELGARLSKTERLERRAHSWLVRRWIARLWEDRLALCERARRQLSDPVRAIYSVFGSQGANAVAVFRCESHLSIYATNGQYLGIAQMGDFARSTYGHSNTLLGQLRAAKRYYDDAGWRPWACAYIVGVL